MQYATLLNIRVHLKLYSLALNSPLSDAVHSCFCCKPPHPLHVVPAYMVFNIINEYANVNK